MAPKGIAFEFIPGITSAIVVPEMANIPITHLGTAVSFRVVTGYEALQKGMHSLTGHLSDKMRRLSF